MKSEAKVYKILKDIKNDDKKQISIIELDNKKYILKKVKNADVTLINMLKNEVNVLYKLKDTSNSPQICYYNFNENNNIIIMELINGKTINELKFENNKQKVSLMLKILSAVKEIHKRNIIHCDLKPDNILLDLHQNIKIIDFGISINNNKNYFMGYGNIHYCSKKQLTKDSIDYVTDIYSLGVIFYELILGRLPFDGTKKEIKEKKRKSEYEKTDNTLLNLIFSKIFSDNEQKYTTIEEFEKDLNIFLKQLRSDNMNEKYKKYLPLGSVLLMKDAKKRVMITGYAVKSPESGEKIWDYIGCLWPEGMIAPDKNLLFDHKDIYQIFAIGYSDDEQKRFMSVLDKATNLNKEKSDIENLTNSDHTI